MLHHLQHQFPSEAKQPQVGKSVSHSGATLNAGHESQAAARELTVNNELLNEFQKQSSELASAAARFPNQPKAVNQAPTSGSVAQTDHLRDKTSQNASVEQAISAAKKSD